MNIKLLKSLHQEIIEIAEDAQNKLENHTLTTEDFLEFLRKVKEKNSLIGEEIGLSVKHQ